jgi:hypothetical protein
MKIYLYLWQYRAEFLEWEIFQAKVAEKVKTHILCSTVLFSKIVPFMRWCGEYGRVGPATDDNTIRYMHISCGYRHTLRICNNYCFSMATMVKRTRLNVTLYVHCLVRLLLFRGGVRPRLSGTAASNGWQVTEWWRIREKRSTYLESDLCRCSFPNSYVPHRHPWEWNRDFRVRRQLQMAWGIGRPI